MSAERDQPIARPETATIRTVQESVTHLAGRQSALVARFYDHLFAMLPETRALFPDDPSGKRVRLVQAMLATVEALDSTEEVEEALQDLGAEHYQMGVQEYQYQYAGHALLRALREVTDDGWSTRHSSAWISVYSWVVSHMVRGARRAQRELPFPEEPGTRRVPTGAHRRESRF